MFRHFNFLLIFIATVFSSTGCHGQTATGKTEADSIAHLAPHACGLCLAEIVELTEHDEVGMVNNVPLDIGLRIKLKTLESSGLIWNELFIHEEPAAELKHIMIPYRKPLIKPETLKVGQTYWLAFINYGSNELHQEDITANPRHLYKAWPFDDPQVNALCKKAVSEDDFKWKPRYDPDIDLSSGHLITNPGKRWKVRVLKQQKILWEKEIKGAMTNNTIAYRFQNARFDGFPAEMPRCGKLLSIGSDIKFDQDNEFGLKPGKYHVRTYFDPENGIRRASFVSRHLEPWLQVASQREYSPEGRMIRDRKFVRIDNEMIRRELSFDRDGNQIGVQDFRYGLLKEGELGNGWVKIEDE